jgi:membrane-bound lytic murein transglycosylase MltF
MLRHLSLVALVAVCGCERLSDVADALSPDESYVERGDVAALQKRGRLRVANVARAHIEELPRLRWGAPTEAAMAREFTDRLGLELQIEDFPSEEAAADALVQGLVDAIVGRKGHR